MENNDVAETVERVGTSTHPTLADNMVVTAVGGTVPPDKFSLPNRKAVMKMLNNNGGFSGIPVQ